jgi:large subunit ribosomal protein L32
MALPKRRHSKTRRDKRRTNWKLRGPTIGSCPQCHSPKRPHRVCPNCGYYGGEKIIEVEQPS